MRLGVDIGGTKVLAVATTASGAPLGWSERPSGRGFGPTDAIDSIRSLSVWASTFGPVDTIGVGVPGLVDHDRGVVRSSVMLDGWSDVPFAHAVSAATTTPCRIDNDVNCAALAEAHVRRDDKDRLMIVVAVGTGIGGAIVLDGHLFRGATGLAGEVGNTTIDVAGARCWCGRRGCLNTSASGSALAEHGDAAAAGERLGAGLANVVNLLNPDLIVLGGGVALNVPTYVEAAERTLRTEAFAEAAAAVRVELPRTGYGAGALGAAML